MIDRIKEWVWVLVGLLAIVFLPLAPVLSGVLALYLADALQPLDLWGAVGWLALAWIMSIYIDLPIRLLVGCVMVKINRNNNEYNIKGSWLPKILIGAAYVGIFCLLTTLTYAVVATAVSAAVAWLLDKSRIFED